MPPSQGGLLAAATSVKQALAPTLNVVLPRYLLRLLILRWAGKGAVLWAVLFTDPDSSQAWPSVPSSTFALRRMVLQGMPRLPVRSGRGSVPAVAGCVAGSGAH